MTSRSEVHREVAVRRRIARYLWLIAFLAIVLLVGERLGLHHWWATVSTPSGDRVLPVAFAGVDHPFHTARAETLLHALLNGELLRWVGQHQGGYPIEFYPAGVAWFEVLLWFVGFGRVPIEIVHKFAVALVFLAPGLAWYWMTRRDRLSIGVVLLALVAHIAIPGGPYHGGYTELMQWGLVTNVAASVCLLFALVAIVAFLDHGNPRAGAIAAAVAATAIYCNPRSAVALAVIGVAAPLALLLPPRIGLRSWRTVLGRLVLVAVSAGCLAAPELISLVRFSDLYTFVTYSAYADAGAWLQESIAAVWLPVFVAGWAGMTIAWFLPGKPATRAAAIALPLYSALTLAAAGDAGGIVPQLEATRLMPFQRLLTIYLAAFAVVFVTRQVQMRWSPRFAALPSVVSAIVAVAVLAFWLRPGEEGVPNPAFMGPSERGLYLVATTDDPVQADFEDAVRAADAANPPGSSILILGSQLSWHQQLWAPFWTAQPLFYNDWLWNWQSDHVGPPGFVAERGNAYPDPAATIDPIYLRQHAIGAIVVSGNARTVAASAGFLTPVRQGAYDVYTVNNATSIVGSASANDRTQYANGHISAVVTADGPVTIRHNWHPRWQATIDGVPMAVERTADGYMRLPLALAGARIELTYSLDAWDWVARGLVIIGLLLATSGFWFRWPNRQHASSSGTQCLD